MKKKILSLSWSRWDHKLQKFVPYEANTIKEGQSDFNGMKEDFARMEASI